MLRLTVLACLLAIAVASHHAPFHVIFQWNFIQYNWPSSSDLEQAETDHTYVAANNVISGIKLWKDKMYLTIPRWKNGVPVTLAVTSATPLNDVTNPILDPYPNWDMQTLGNCSAFQFVRSMEIDPAGRMWVLDTGRTETMMETPVTKCPPRLVILDLKNNGQILRNYVFPDEIAPKNSACLNDIVLDHEDGGVAFITDNGSDDPGIIVYSLRDNASWKIRNSRSMRAQAEAEDSIAAGTGSGGVNGIALSPPGPNRLLYYSPLSSFHLYSIPVSILKNPTVGNPDNFITDVGRKQSQTDGMIMTNDGTLYFGLLNDNSIAVWDSATYPSFIDGEKKVARDHGLLQWPDTFGIDEDGQIWCVSNAFRNFVNNQVDISQPNYRVLRSWIGAKSYQYFENGTAPELPEITAVGTNAELNEGLGWAQPLNREIDYPTSEASFSIFQKSEGRRIVLIILLINIFLRI